MPQPALVDRPVLIALGQDPVEAYLASLAPGSRPTMRRAANLLARILSDGSATAATLPWAELRYPHTSALRAVLVDRYAPATANKLLACLRGILGQCWRSGAMTAEDHLRAVDLPRVRGTGRRRGRDLDPAEVALVLVACDHDKRAFGVRDAVIVGLGYAGGLRRAELAALSLDDWVRDTSTLEVQGKGARRREVPVPDWLTARLECWAAVRGHDPGPLVTPLTPAGALLLRPLSGEAIRRRLAVRCAEAALGERIAPHDLRRHFVTALLDDGADLALAARAAGHASVSTTQPYDRRPDRRVREAISRLAEPA